MSSRYTVSWNKRARIPSPCQASTRPKANFGAFLVLPRGDDPAGRIEFPGRVTAEAENVATLTPDDPLSICGEPGAVVIELSLEVMEPQAVQVAKLGC
jgi:hypothetical protein